MTFQLDTSGSVPHLAANGEPIICGGCVWSDLSPFTQGYIEALFLTAGDEPARFWTRADSPDGIGKDCGFSDLAPETLARIIADCEAAATVRGSDGYEATGREFWMVRQAGMIVAFPPLTVQLGDDGKVRFAEGR